MAVRTLLEVNLSVAKAICSRGEGHSFNVVFRSVNGMLNLDWEVNFKHIYRDVNALVERNGKFCI